ncbi:Spermidine-binding periplasmic protein SpuE [bacterium HR40]|nr:Spermidine-binding periplasmic protein SpuE [bacterium HR40]
MSGRALRGWTVTSRRRFLGGVAVAVAIGSSSRLSVAAEEEKKVNVYNWDTYIGETTIEDFTAATGIEVRYDLFASNEELFAKLREGNPGYDVIFPSNNYVERMIAADMLVALDHERIPNLAHIDPLFADPQFDRGRRYSVPYMWGTMGIGYRRSKVEPKSWKVVFEPEESLRGRIAYLNDVTVIQMALKYLGYSLNSRNPAEIDKAAELIIRAKPYVKAFAPDTGQDLLLSGEVDLVTEWNGDILQVMLEDEDLGYVVPEEGSILWEDTMCIPKGAPHPQNAHTFINYILTPEVHASIAEFIKYACPNRTALQYLPVEDRENPAIYPPREVLEKCEVTVYKGEEVESLYDRALTRVLAA